MERRTSFSHVFVLILALLAVFAFSIPWGIRWKRSRSSKAVFDAAESIKKAQSLQTSSCLYWTGDVARLYNLGLISKDVALADSNPIAPLVSTPQPFHGYLFIAMDSGPSPNSEEPITLRGQKQNKVTSA